MLLCAMAHKQGSHAGFKVRKNAVWQHLVALRNSSTICWTHRTSTFFAFVAGFDAFDIDEHSRNQLFSDHVSDEGPSLMHADPSDAICMAEYQLLGLGPIPWCNTIHDG